ncbi:MBL fold metallo-hydrolase [Xylanimonas allomyrinae]|uniref:MBL fold metallo-hydrolase n=1 Tax=Xylanimonas allomyrinae TaxID=2509459 RepID=A0A4P6ESC4_9MICO|nr:MBL fold metallo-hydrolase [Xylanimonas allomyrinae]QAY64873.1 MBL fold metallo-hydrolase [Xylanimonas allomyrinae]
MTLDGTRSYVLRAPTGAAGATGDVPAHHGDAPRSPHAGAVVVDPGPLDEAHLRALAAAGPVALVLVTHRHADHTAGAGRLRELTGAPVRALDPHHCLGAAPLRDGEVLHAAGLRVEVLATPGHTADSACFVVTPDDGDPVVLTGDTVLGAGSTVLAEPDGSLAGYLASLDRLERVATPSCRGLPGHGPVVEDLAGRVRAYRAHRLERLGQVRAALEALGADDGTGVSADAVVALVYADVPAAVRAAARQSVVAQIAYLRSRPR